MNGNNYRINLDKLLGNECNLSGEQKKFFRALAEGLEVRQDEEFNILRRNTFESMNNIGGCIPIVTVLMNNPGNTELFLMIDQDEQNNIVFLDDHIDNIPDTDEFECCGDRFQLVRTDRYVQKERIIANVFKTYDINQPYCFSPFARRAFYINKWNEKEQKYVPFDYQRNNICSSIQSEKNNIIFGDLYWNVEQINAEKKLRPKIIPSRNGIEYVRFENCDENTYICSGASNDAVRVERTCGGGCIDIYREDYENYRPQLLQIKIYPVDPSAENRFSNVYDRTIPLPVRAITEADVSQIIRKFYPFPDEYAGIEGHITNNKTIKDYANRYRYVYDDISYISVSNKNFCYLYFEDSEVDKFFADRVNFFISFMRYCYPNFYWVGVRK